ncbi:hypothetical protein DH2020_042803 [Rehmannia glutinosa]|uniref:Pectinesterase inhibitor domain-containing protein n=1 Tax=Rehmannia glutinosa TaxID=99300 RepID=A0ABR0UMD5_REHGL
MYLLIMLLINGKLSASATLLEEVCHQTEDPAFCLKVLGSDPRTKNAGLPELAQITIDLGSYSDREAAGHLKRGEYTDLNVDGGLAGQDGHDCEDAFKEPPAYRSPLTKENYRLMRFGEIIIIIANLLG